MQRVVFVCVLAAVLTSPAGAWAANVTLAADHRVARYDDMVRFKGSVASAEPQQVSLLRDGVVVRTVVASGGRFVVDLRARKPGTFVARSGLGDSPPVALRLQPRLRLRVVGQRRIGHRVFVVGRLLPARSGAVVLGRTRVRVAANGRFRLRVPTSRGLAFNRRLRVRPLAGYVPVARRLRVRLALPALQMGSHGPSVRALKQRLRQLGYALPNLDSGFGYRTYEAVLAFQKVHRLDRTGRVDGRLWRLVSRSAVPQPRVRRGDYLEIDKSRQVLMEVRGGKVVRVIHVSTGATGNTPVGTWRVYREVFGWDWILYHPMYFLRGFAIHGYPEVPTWPASHGCVRVPLWIAASLRERWGLGSIVRVYP
ncbi:MAG TPA: L,D-transpeptidase family protein [Gaiellaceae bacterium]|nr:L,D-transpeptidase family protein [Gaiellaceae bacterium]